MNNAITFFVGCVTFVLTMGVKIPLKMFTKYMVNRFCWDAEYEEIVRKRVNLLVILLALIIALLCYTVLQMILELDHFKLCCALKATAIAVSIYYIYEKCMCAEIL